MKKNSKNSFSKFKKHMKAHKTTDFLQTTLKNYVKKNSFRFTFHVKTASFSKFQFFHPQIQRTTS